MNSELERLKALQSENAELHQKISQLKKVQADNVSPLLLPTSIIRTEETHDDENELNAALKRVRNLKKQLMDLREQKIFLNTQYTDLCSNCQRNIIPKMKNEEKETELYFKTIFEKLSTIPNVDTKALKDLFEKQAEKKKKVYELTEKYQQIQRILAFQKAQNADAIKTIPTPAAAIPAPKNIRYARVRRHDSFSYRKPL